METADQAIQQPKRRTHQHAEKTDIIKEKSRKDKTN